MKMTVKSNIIWKRTSDTHSLKIDDCNGAFMATVDTFNADGSLSTTVSWPFQTFDGCLHFFDRTLTDMGIVGLSGSLLEDWPTGTSTVKPTRWPNGDLRKNKWES